MSSVFGLNARPHTATRFPSESVAERLASFSNEPVLLVVVHRFDGLENPETRRRCRARS